MFLEFSQCSCFVHESRHNIYYSSKQERLQRLTAKCGRFKASNYGNDFIEVSRAPSSEPDLLLKHSDVLYKNTNHTGLGQSSESSATRICLVICIALTRKYRETLVVLNARLKHASRETP